MLLQIYRYKKGCICSFLGGELAFCKDRRQKKSVNGGGGRANPLTVTKIGVLSEKEKKMQNVLKRKNEQKHYETFMQGYLLKTFFFFHKKHTFYTILHLLI